MGILYDSKMIKKVSTDMGHRSYGRLFFNTNEDFDILFKNINFNDKNVLSVLASGDQMFMAYNRGAKNVDTFDKNKLTLYYYYMRKWSIEYFKEKYPYALLRNDYDKLEKLLDIVKTNSREEYKALLFWRGLCKDRFLFSSIFIKDIDLVPFRDSEQLKKLIPENINFNRVDFFKKLKSKINGKYDIIIFSNILEWIYGNEETITIVRDNLYNLLNDKGIVLCSELKCRLADRKLMERRIFDSHFTWKNIKSGVGYIYKKRDYVKRK